MLSESLIRQELKKYESYINYECSVSTNYIICSELKSLLNM